MRPSGHAMSIDSYPCGRSSRWLSAWWFQLPSPLTIAIKVTSPTSVAKTVAMAHTADHVGITDATTQASTAAATVRTATELCIVRAERQQETSREIIWDCCSITGNKQFKEGVSSIRIVQVTRATCISMTSSVSRIRLNALCGVADGTGTTVTGVRAPLDQTTVFGSPASTTTPLSSITTTPKDTIFRRLMAIPLLRTCICIVTPSTIHGGQIRIQITGWAITSRWPWRLKVSTTATTSLSIENSQATCPCLSSK